MRHKPKWTSFLRISVDTSTSSADLSWAAIDGNSRRRTRDRLRGCILGVLGLGTCGVNNEWYEPFPFTAGVSLGPKNRLASGDKTWELDKDWRPIAFSKNGTIPESEVVFAGYGIVAPKDGDQDEYDSYVHLDVENKWVLVFRQLPSEVTPERRQHLARYSSLRYKAMAARDRGAVGMIVVSGPTSKVRKPLVPLQLDGALSGTSWVLSASRIKWLRNGSSLPTKTWKNFKRRSTAAK